MNYPNKLIRDSSSKNASDIKISKSRLGINFENSINESNKYYLNKGVAAIYKKPTPIQVVKVSYQKRSAAKITDAYYMTPSTTDYNGIYKAKYIDFEAKSCSSTSFSFAHIYTHQINHLLNIKKLGGIAFVIIEFTKYQKVFVIDIDEFYKLYLASLDGERKSISYNYFVDNCEEVKTGYSPRIDFLKTIDILYFK